MLENEKSAAVAPGEQPSQQEIWARTRHRELFDAMLRHPAYLDRELTPEMLISMHARIDRIIAETVTLTELDICQDPDHLA